MNRDIVILREAIKKIIPMLAGKGLIVTQMGTQAYVAPHPITGLPHRVNIPLLPDAAEPEFVQAIQGFIDHEVAHVLFTDFLYKAREKSKRLHNLHNIIEDTMIERLMGEEFPGSKRNIAKLQEFFVTNLTAPALAKATSKQEEFDYLLVPVTRALAGHQIFQDWLDDNNYWEHELVKAFMERFSQASKDKMPKLASTEETYEIALEVEAILYPPPPPAPPQPEPQEEEQQEQEPQDQEKGESDQEPSEGEDDKDHSDEQQTGDGEGKGEREHTEDNDKASGGEGESDEEEKEDDAGDGEDKGTGEGKEKTDAEDGDTSEDEGDGASDADPSDEQDADEGSGSSEEHDEEDAEASPGRASKDKADADEEESGGDDADDQDGSGQPTDADDDGHDAEGEEPSDGESAAPNASDDEESADSEDQQGSGQADAGEPDDEEEGGNADESDAGASGDDDSEGDEGETNGSNLAIEQPDTPEGDGEAPEEDNEEDGIEMQGIGYDPNVNPFSEMTDDALDEKDLSSALVKIIVKEAITACRRADYTVFTREYDIIKPLHVPEPDDEPTAKNKFRSKWITELEDETRALTGVMQKDIERMMAAQSRVFNVAGQRSGRLNSAGLHRLTAGDPRVFSKREEIRAKDTAVSLLSDCSGSMRNAPMATAMSASYALASVLERCNIPSECMGFTTISAIGGDSPLTYDRARQFQEDIRKEQNSGAGVTFSRTTPIYMPIFKDFNERLTAEVKKRFAYQRRVQPFMGANVDGESLEYAAMRLAKRKEKRKVIIVLSDGFPAGATGDKAHLKYMVQNLQKQGFDLVGIGIKSNAVARFYDNYIVLDEIADLPKAVMGELKKILMA